MAIKKNNPGCGCCNDCERCEGEVVPDSLTLTMSGWPDTLYFYRRCWTTTEVSGACTKPLAIPANASTAIQRYKITGLSAKLNKAFLTNNIFGVDGNGYCTITSETFSEEFAAETELAFQTFFVFPNDAIACPTSFQPCTDVTVRIEVSFNTYSMTVNFFDTADDALIFGFAVLGIFPNDYCEEQTGIAGVVTNYPLVVTNVPTGFVVCSIDDPDGCGTFNSFNVYWTLTPGFA